MGCIALPLLYISVIHRGEGVITTPQSYLHPESTDSFTLFPAEGFCIVWIWTCDLQMTGWTLFCWATWKSGQFHFFFTDHPWYVSTTKPVVNSADWTTGTADVPHAQDANLYVCSPFCQRLYDQSSHMTKVLSITYAIHKRIFLVIV